MYKKKVPGLKKKVKAELERFGKVWNGGLPNNNIDMVTCLFLSTVETDIMDDVLQAIKAKYSK